MRVALASRIYDPEPAAAAFRLRALAEALAEEGHDVQVLTVAAPRGTVPGPVGERVRVRRW
ncbi:MAG: glycosyltransferase WbuB, partial [Cellulosimicrobium funkei]